MTDSPAVAPSSAAASRLGRLKAQWRKPGEASFFFYDAHFKSDAVKVLPGEYFVHDEDIVILTTLGSCIAACLWDGRAKVGGMNHFLLPEVEGAGGHGASGRYGSCAMEVLINELLKRGATRASLEAKVFGGGQVIGGLHSVNVGTRNTAFVLDYLRTERIAVVSKDVQGAYSRKVCFLPASGRALVKRLGAANAGAVLAQERAAAAARNAAGGGSIDLF